MSLNTFIKRYRGLYNRNVGVEDLSARQRREAVRNALAEWSENNPRQHRGNARLIAGSREVLLPYDFLRAAYSDLLTLYSSAGSSESGIIATSRLQDPSWLQYYSDPFSSPIGPTGFAPGYDESVSSTVVPVKHLDRGGAAIDLDEAASATKTIEIRYEARHQIEDAGRKITVGSLPSNNDPITVNGANYTFKTAPATATEIQIADTIYAQAVIIADKLVADDKADAFEDANDVIVRPFTLGTAVTVTVDGTRLTSSLLPALNTVPEIDRQKVYHLVMGHLAMAKAREMEEKEKAELAAEHRADAKFYFDRIAPYLRY